MLVAVAVTRTISQRCCLQPLLRIERLVDGVDFALEVGRFVSVCADFRQPLQILAL